MFIYTNCVLEDEAGNKKLAALAIRKEKVVTFRRFVDDSDAKVPFIRHAAIGMLGGDEWFVTSSFMEIKNQLDPNSDDGGISKIEDVPTPVLDVGQ